MQPLQTQFRLLTNCNSHWSDSELQHSLVDMTIMNNHLVIVCR